MGSFLLFLLFFFATLRRSHSWAAKGACRWRKNNWWVSCSGHTDGTGGREGGELVGAIERTTTKAGGGYQHCTKRKIFFWTNGGRELEEEENRVSQRRSEGCLRRVFPGIATTTSLLSHFQLSSWESVCYFGVDRKSHLFVMVIFSLLCAYSIFLGFPWFSLCNIDA